VFNPTLDIYAPYTHTSRRKQRVQKLLAHQRHINVHWK